jgi:hypothetical protein
MDLDDVLPICYEPKKGYVINLSGMEKNSPTSFGYIPFGVFYKTREEAEEARKEIFKVIKSIKIKYYTEL